MADPTYKNIRYETEGPLVVLTINRPEAMNSFSPDAHAEMADAFDRFAADDNLRVAIFTGAGERAFCAGSDLKFIAAHGDKPKPASGFAGITHRHDLWKPVIAAVNGVCVGGGVEILGACDIAVACEEATFGLPEVRVGLGAFGGGVLQRFARGLPMKETMYLALTGDRISAERALRMHLINEIVPRKDLMKRAREIADMIIAGAPISVAATKQMIVQSLKSGDLHSTMHDKYELAQKMFVSEDAKEGPRAFAEKRKPNWKGR